MSRSEAGVVTAEGGYSVTGSYQYRGPDGATYRVDFTADQRGYRPRYGIQLQGSRRSLYGKFGMKLPQRSEGMGRLVSIDS